MTVTALRQPDDGWSLPARPIHDVEAEAAVLGACLLSGRAVEPLSSEVGLRPEHFWRSAHRAVWQALTALADEGAPVDPLTVARHVEHDGTVDAPEQGWAAFVDELTSRVPSPGNAKSYATAVIEAWRWEQSRRAHLDALSAVSSRDEGALTAAEQAASSLVADTPGEHLLDPERAAAHMLDWLDRPRTGGLPLPWPKLARTLRLRPGHLTVVAGWSHIGKSLWVDTLASHVGRKGHRVVLWDNEMPKEERWAAQITRDTGVPVESIVDGKVTDRDKPKVLDALKQLPFVVAECPGWPAEQVARHIRQVKPDLAIVDHFHALPRVAKTEDADAAIQALVAAAGQARCHVIVVCQLNQERNKQTVRPAPVHRDLRGTGNLFNLPSNVVFVHRDEEELRDEDGTNLGRSLTTDEGTIDVAKQRGGRRDCVSARFDEWRLRWLEAVS
ncbi:MAG TPA: DnaB-like helicase C-terminal domain-containing protein [Segeticoccus sp.]|nr:DnaB-like helicase C-terminal domain-containing protein [Segeticoccus sp.]